MNLEFLKKLSYLNKVRRTEKMLNPSPKHYANLLILLLTISV